MKRLHVHVAVADLGGSVEFYRTLFGAEPSVLESDYAKWMLDDPRVNFAISARGRAVGLDHLGIQVDDDRELATVAARLQQTGQRTVQETGVTCCYAEGNKHWVADAAGILWESFHTTGAATRYGHDNAEADALPRAAAGACCSPAELVAPDASASEKTAGGCCGPSPGAA